MVKENITWITFDDDGSIMKLWNAPGSPTFYILDHHGTIRNKWVGNPGPKTLDAALEKLILEADEAARK
jgi:hypothetical protein